MDGRILSEAWAEKGFARPDLTVENFTFAAGQQRIYHIVEGASIVGRRGILSGGKSPETEKIGYTYCELTAFEA